MSLILLTGASGFLGGRLARRLAQGHQLILLKRAGSDLSRLADLAGRFRAYDLEHDGRRRSLAEQPVEVVLHAAADYGRDGHGWSRVAAANLTWPLELLEAARAAGVGSFVNCGTVLPPTVSPYALSKNQFGQWLKLAAPGWRVVNLALQFFYGPGENPGSFISQTLRGLLEPRASLPFTAGQQRRDFIYIDDAVEAIGLVLENLEGLGAGWQEVQVGSGQATSLRQVVELARELAASPTRLDFGALAYRPGESMLLKADTSRLERLGWRPEVDLRQGLTRAIDHLRAGAGQGGNQP